MSLRPVRKDRGAALVVGLIMLVLITLMLITALNLGTANFRSVSNMQYREEAIAAANQAIEQVISSKFTLAPAAETIFIDVDGGLATDTNYDYRVEIAKPVCISATQAANPPPSSIPLGPTMTLDSTWNTVWELDATVTAAQNAGGAATRVHAGVRVLLTGTQKDAVCT